MVAILGGYTDPPLMWQLSNRNLHAAADAEKHKSVHCFEFASKNVDQAKVLVSIDTEITRLSIVPPNSGDSLRGSRRAIEQQV